MRNLLCSRHMAGAGDGPKSQLEGIMEQTIRARLPGFEVSKKTLISFVAVMLLVDHLSGATISNISQLEAAAKSGYVPQEIELAAAYFTGNGVPQDAKQAA